MITRPLTRPLTSPLTRAITDAGGGWTPAALFAASEQGVWYDPSDMSTMYQDVAGTTPVYMPGQGQVDPPVGLLLDKRLGLTLGPELWVDASAQFFGEASRVSPGVYRVYTSTGAYTAVQLPGLIAGEWYELSLNVDLITTPGGGLACDVTTPVVSFTSVGPKKYLLRTNTNVIAIKRNAIVPTDIQISNVSVRRISGNHAFQSTTTSRPALSARYNLLTATDTLTTQSVTTVATSYTLKLTGAGSVTLSGTAAGSYSAGTYTITCTAGSLTLTVSGSVTQADLRIANDGVGLPAYQRVVDANTYDTAGFPLYLKFDGVDDWLQTAAVDFSGTDVVAIATAYRKMSDVSIGEVFALSGNPTGNTGTFGFYTPETGGGTAAAVFFARGASSIISGQRIGTAPISCVAGGWASLSMPYMRYRINQGASLTSSVATGGGNYGNYPLFIGRRNGTSFPFSGRLYSLLIRGAATPDATIATVESYLNQKARIY